MYQEAVSIQREKLFFNSEESLVLGGVHVNELVMWNGKRQLRLSSKMYPKPATI